MADNIGGKGKNFEPLAPAPEKGSIEERLTSFESPVHKLENQVEMLGASKSSLQEIEVRLKGTPALGLEQRFRCSCGASGFVALHIQCTKCGKETWWGWFPGQ